MLPQIQPNPNPYKQVVYLYPDGEIRYKVSLCHSERGNDTDVTKVVLSNAQRGDKEISKKELSKELKPGWGKLSKPKQFTVYAKNTIRRIGGAMQLEFGKERLAVMTLTIPGSTNKVIETIAKYSGYIMNRIQTYLTDNYQFKDGRKYVVGVAELQKRGMLHWHFLVALEDELLINLFRKKIEAFWFRVLKQLSEISGIDLFKRKQGDSWEKRYGQIKERAVDIQPVRKNVAAYLAKYMSKGYHKAKSKSENIYYSPSRWWSKSDDAIALMHSWTVSYQLPSIDEAFMKGEMIPAIKDFFKCAEMWQVESINNYTKQVSALIGRKEYEACKEWCDDLIPVLLNMCEKHEIENIKRQKDKRKYIKELSLRKQEKMWDRKELTANDVKLKREYEKLINEFRMSPDAAYNAIFGTKRSLGIEEFIRRNKFIVVPETKWIYSPELGCLIEVSQREYERLRYNSE